MGRADKDIPTLRYGNKIYPENLAGLPINTWGEYFYVDGNKTAGGAGKTWADAFYRVQDAIDAATSGDVVYIKPKTPGIWDPVAYAETLIIPYTKPHLTLMGVSAGGANVYGAMPHIGVTSGTTPVLTIRAPGCRISNLSFSATGATAGGGILLDDDGSTTSAYGTTIDNCYFYECLAAGNTVSEGGAIYWSADGGAWELRVLNNYFYDCSAGLSLLGTSGSRPTDVLIQGNTFSSSVNTTPDCDIYLAGGSGAQNVVIDSNTFASVDGVNATEDHYIDLTGCEGILSNNVFACKTGSEDTPLTFGATTHTAAKIPATIRMARNYGEGAVGSKAGSDGIVYRQD